MRPRHESFTLERTYAACRAHVFALWSDPDLKRRWFVDNDGPGWETLEYGLDFRVGGREHGRWRMAAGDLTMAGEHANETVFLEIVEGERIIFAYTMAMDGRIHSASLATVTFEEAGGGTKLTFTEQLTALEGSDGAERRSNGWGWLLGNIEATLAETTA